MGLSIGDIIKGIGNSTANTARTEGTQVQGTAPTRARTPEEQAEIDAAKAAAQAGSSSPTPVFTTGPGGTASPTTAAAPPKSLVGAVKPSSSALTAALAPARNSAPLTQAVLGTAPKVSSVGGTGGSTSPGGVYQLTPGASTSGVSVSAPLPTGIVNYDPGSNQESDREGLSYQLGGNKNFTSELTAAIQANAAANSANLIGTGNAAANSGAQAQQSLNAIGTSAQNASRTAAADVTGVSNLLGFNGQGYTQQGDSVQGRAAPTLDVAQQNGALGQSLGQADALNQAGAGAYSLSTDAMGRQAPGLNVGQQNATLEQANLLSSALGSSGAKAQQLGLSADGRAAPQAQLAGANAAIGAAQGNAGNVGAVGNQALALSQGAAGRQAIAPANYGAAQSMIGQGVGSSMSAQQSGQALTGLEATQGPSAAQAQLAQSQAAAAAQAMSLARSGRGWGGSAQGLADAQRAQAAGLMTANNQAAQLRATEDAAWRQRQASNLSTGAQISNQSSGLQLQAGQQLGQQAQADQAAALQSRAQNDQLQSQMYSYGLQGAQGAGELNAAAGQQLSQNAIQQAQIDQQATAQNDARLGQMTALGMQGQQQAAALQQAEAAQYAAQAAQNQQASLQQTQMNDAYSAQMYGMGMQGQQQSAALQQAAAAQYGDQATQNLQAGLQQTQLNDQFATNLYGQSNAALQGDIQGKLGAGQLGLAGAQANADATGMGATSALAGMSQQQQAALSAAQLESNALLQTGQLAQVQTQLSQNQISDWLKERGIKEGVNVAERGQTMQMIGSGLAAAGTAAAFLSDVRAKENIVPDGKPARKSYEELKAELSEGDALLNPKPPVGGGKRPFTLQDTENEYALGGFVPNGVSPGRGSGVVGPGGPAYDRAMDSAKNAANKDKPGKGGPLGAAAEAAKAFGNSMQSMPGNVPDFAPPDRPRYRELPELRPLQFSSDVRAKTDVKNDGASGSGRADLEEMRAAIRDLGTQAGSNMPQSFGPPRGEGEILESAKATPSYSYDYKDPAAVGAAPGRQYGNMAQSLAQQPATAALVQPGPDGKLTVDGARLGATAYAGLGQLARKTDYELDSLRKQINSLGQARA